MMDIASEVFLGESTNVLKLGLPKSEGRLFSEAFEYASTAVCGTGDLDLYAIVSSIFGDSKLQQSMVIIDNFLDKIVQNAVRKYRSQDTVAVKGENLQRETTFLEDLVHETDDTQHIKHAILNILLAGKDTTTALLSNTFFIIAKRPDIYAKLRSEIEILDSLAPSEQQLKDLKYLRYVLQESMSQHLKKLAFHTMLTDHR